MLLAMSMTHWHAPFNTTVLDLFTTVVNVPLRKPFKRHPHYFFLLFTNNN